MILVTVGTTMPFDELLEEVDRLAGEGRFGEPVLCQSGHSSYRMKHAEQFVGRPSLRDLIDESSLVITHGGSTVIQLLMARKPFVAFPNPRGAGDHQTSFLTELSRCSDISWSRDVGDLEHLTAERRVLGPARIDAAIPRVVEGLRVLAPSPSMARARRRKAGWMASAGQALALGVMLGAGAVQEARAQSAEEIARELGELRTVVEAQSDRLDAQEVLLRAQAAEISRLKGLPPPDLAEMRGGQRPAPVQVAQAEVTPAMPTQPVGEAPPEQEVVPVEALPEGSGVLTQRGHFQVEPSFELSHSSTNRVVFRGIEIAAPGVLIGALDAVDADRNTLAAGLGFRYGLTNRLEVELRGSYLYRNDRQTTVRQADEAVTLTEQLDNHGLGDVEAAIRYQINRGRGGWPVFVANLRIKSDTGEGPFDVQRDAFGVAQELATGSGFWGVEPGVSVLYATDPAVLFAGVSYLAHLPEDVNTAFGDPTPDDTVDDAVQVGRVDPGDSLNANFGFGFALNERFSYSLGYKHSYIFETRTELNGEEFDSEALQVGVFLLSLSYRLTPRVTLATNLELGATADAPDARILIRLPIRF